MNVNSIKKYFTIYNALLAACIIFFLGVLVYGFPNSPSPWFDEGINLGIARSWVEHGVYSMQVGPNEFAQERYLLITTNYPLLFFIGVAFKFFGVGLVQARVVMVGFMLVFTVLLFVFIRRYYGKEAALMGLALLVTFAPFYGNGKSALGEVPGLAYFLAALLWFDRKKPWQIFMTGFLFGLAAATKSIYMLFLVAAVGGEVWSACVQKKIDRKRWFWLGIGMLIPIVIWFITLLPEEVTASFFQKMAQLYSNPYKVEHTIGTNVLRFFTESTPLHFLLLWGSFLFVKGIRRLRSLTVVEVTMTIFIVLNLFFYLRTVGWYRYFFPAHLIVIALFPGSLIEWRDHLNIPRWIKIYGPRFLVLILFVLQAGNLVFHAHDRLYFNPEPQQFTLRVKAAAPPNSTVTVVDNPVLAFLLQGMVVSQYVQTSPHMVVGREPFADGVLPLYLVTPDWAQDPYLSLYLSLRGKYDLIVHGAEFNLYRLHF